MNKRTVTWLVSGDEGYGVRQAVRQLITTVRANGWNVVIISLCDGAFAKECRSQGFEVCSLGVGLAPAFPGGVLTKPFELFRMRKFQKEVVPKLASVLHDVSADAVHFLWPNLVSIVGAAAKRCSIPSLWEMPNHLGNRYRFGWNRWLYQFACWRYGITPLANSRSTADTLGRWPVKPIVFYLGVDAHRFHSATVQLITREELGIPRDAIAFGIIARMTWTKGQEYILRAMLTLGDHDPPLHLVLLGGPIDNSYTESLRSIAAEAGAAQRLHVIGSVPDPERYYGTFDVAINSRIDPEPFGLSVIEAMMMERPVLVHALGGPAETVLDGETGWHMSNPSVESYADGIRRALKDRPKWHQMGKQSRQHAVENFSLERQTKYYMEIVERLVTKRDGKR